MKYEEEYLKAYANTSEARRELGAYFRFYSNWRPHQALGYRTSAEVFPWAIIAPAEEPKGRGDSSQPVLLSSAEAPGLSLDSTSILSN